MEEIDSWLVSLSCLRSYELIFHRTAGICIAVGGNYLVKYDLNTRRREERKRHLEQYADSEEKSSQ